MSYTIHIDKKVAGSLTFNCKPMLDAAWSNLDNQYGFNSWKTGIQDEFVGRELLQDLVEELRNNMDKYKPLEHPTWGHYEDAVRFLSDALNLCEEGDEIILYE